MELKTEKREVFLVNYKNLNEFINYHYPNLKDKFEIVADEELNNDSEILIGVTGEIDEYTESEIKSGETDFMTTAYMDDLCKKGVIPAGKYLIQVS